MTRKRRAQAEAQGRRAETLAAWALRLKGWRIVGRRCRVPGGEVDIIARRGRTLAFVEVKWRADPRALDNAVDPYRLRRVAAAAQQLGPRFARPGDTQRIDVMVLAPGRWPHHLENVWLGG